MRWTGSGQETLDAWCESVGPPAVLSSGQEPGAVTRLVIVSWNIHVGGGRVEDLLSRLWSDEAARGRTGTILLLEEAYRAGEDVPAAYPPGLRVPSAIRPGRPGLDVVALARTYNLSLAYVPSMRNGPATDLLEREDRGNAVLSTEPLSDVRAIELPFGRQRRVAIAATVTPRGSAARPLRVIVTHFDTNGDRVAQAEALGQSITDLGEMPLVVGGDLNARQGASDGAVRAVSRYIPLESCGSGRTTRWPLRLDLFAFFLGRLDYMFSTLENHGVRRGCETLSNAFGSDHLPVLMTVEY
jgi:endonuclease/exonuclease/phosphatase family metal-dependent hydrolase